MDQSVKCEEERLELLANFVTVVESILTTNPVHVCHVSGAFDRTQDSILPILMHGLDVSQIYDQLWEFILGLRVITPNLWPTELFKPPDQESIFLISLWLKLSFKAQKLSSQMQALVSYREGLEKYYADEAFLRSEKFTMSLITALQALDQNAQHILAKIDHKLMAQFVLKKSLSVDIQYDMYSTSPQPDNEPLVTSHSLTDADIFSTCSPSYQELSPIAFKVSYDEIFSDIETTDFGGDRTDSQNQLSSTLEGEVGSVASVVAPRPRCLYAADVFDDDYGATSEGGFNSLYDTITENWLLKPPPFILKHLTKSSRLPVNLEKYRISSNEHAPVNKKVIESKQRSGRRSSRPSHIRSYSDGTKFMRRMSAPLGSCQLAQSPPDLSLKLRRSGVRFMEDGGHSIEAGAYGFFPRPRPGQHLFDFLSDCYTATTNAQLDRENAHFSIAEAVIGAIEQMNYEAHLRSSQTNPAYACLDSDEDQPTKRKGHRLRKKRVVKKKSHGGFCTSDDPATSEHSDSSSDSNAPGDCEVSSDDRGEVLQNSSEDSLRDRSASAENVAISLLLNYNSKLLPKAIDLQWRFSEEEELSKKPVISSDTTTPEESLEVVGNTSIRGTAEWAPPRPQLVLAIHKKPNRMSSIIGQKWRCAGCGLKVCSKMSRHFRFCTYLGKYFCTSCHTNKRSIIPASVVFNWDFNKYAVSNFSSELLMRMQSDPLFNVTSLNVSLYKQSQSLNQCHVYRLQLFHARKYVVTCRNAEKEKELLNSVPLHWSTEPNVYSIDDLLAVKSSVLLEHITNLTSVLIKHISSCKVCMGQGFVCETCRKGAPIFPFQLDAVTQCSKCKACYHLQCFQPPDTICGRCLRRERKHQENDTSIDLPSS